MAWVPTAPEILPTRMVSTAATRRSRCRFISSHQSASFNPMVIGSACTPWVLPIIRVSLCSSAWTGEGGNRLVHFIQQEATSLDQLQVKAGIQHVAGGKAKVEPAALGSHGAGDWRR